MKGVGDEAGPAGQGPAPDLARGVNGAGDRRRSKGEALLRISAGREGVADGEAPPLDMSRGFGNG